MKTFYDVVNSFKGSTLGDWMVMGNGGVSKLEYNEFVLGCELEYIKYKKEFEMSKTVTHEGKVYEIGKRYLFSDFDGGWRREALIDIDPQDIFPFVARACRWKLCKVDESEAGTITDAPVELVDGCAYRFNWIGGDTCGIYNEEFKSFSTLTDFLYASSCTNITRLVPEVK